MLINGCLEYLFFAYEFVLISFVVALWWVYTDTGPSHCLLNNIYAYLYMYDLKYHTMNFSILLLRMMRC